MMLVVVFFNCRCNAQSTISDKLEDLFDNRYDQKDAGASVLVVKNGKVLYEEQYGLANVELGVLTSVNTKYPIGSLTKQFTAAAILLLEERGKISTSDYIGKFLPDFDQDRYPITISHLLTHTSGIPSDNSNKDIRRNLSKHMSADDFLHYLIDASLNFNPGDEYDYSNNGYILLGLIIEQASGMSYEQFLEDNIFVPSGLKNMQIGYFQDIIQNRASGYNSDDNDVLINATYHSSSHAAGAIVSAPADMIRWTTALFNHNVLSAKSLDAMLHNYTLNDGEKTKPWIWMGTECNRR